MSAKDVSSLTTEQVDIASALSFDQSFSFMGSENKEKATLREAKRDFYKVSLSSTVQYMDTALSHSHS